MELFHRRCCGLDVHKESLVACLRLVSDGKVTTEVRTFKTTTADLVRLLKWLAANGCTHVANESDRSLLEIGRAYLSRHELSLILANAAQLKNVPGRQTDVKDAVWLADRAADGWRHAFAVKSGAVRKLELCRWYPENEAMNLGCLMKDRIVSRRLWASGQLTHPRCRSNRWGEVQQGDVHPVGQSELRFNEFAARAAQPSH